MLNPFYYQMMHIMLKNTELLKHSKLGKNTPTYFGIHRNHLQGDKVSARLKITHLVNSLMQILLNNAEPFLLPNDAHNVKKRRVIKTF